MAPGPTRREALRLLGLTSAAAVGVPWRPDGAGSSSALVPVAARPAARRAEAVQAPPLPPRGAWNFLSKVVHAPTSTVYVHAVDVTLDHAFGLDSGKDLTVYADTIRLTDTIHLPGRRVHLLARQIVAAGADAGIDVSGASITTPPPPQVDGTLPGQDGADGDCRPGDEASTCRAGGAGGRIAIFAGTILGGRVTFRANGGAGGRGQDGGNGQNGAAGQPGADAVCRNYVVQTGAQPGGAGQRGGDAGRGGNGGRGGDAGQVSIELAALPQPGQIAIELRGGRGGEPGVTGTAGTGGPGGIGGRHGEFGTTGRNDRMYCRLTDRRQPTGPRGQNGALPSSAPAMGANGRDGDADSAIRETTTAALGARASLSALQMYLHHAELSYLRGQMRESLDGLAWIIALTGSAPGTATPAAGEPGAPSPGSAPPAPAEWAAFRTRVRTLHDQFVAGLDYYGLPWDFAPLVHVEQFDASARTLLAIARNVEHAYVTYWTAREERGREHEALRVAVAGARGAAQALASERDDLDQRVTATQATIAGLNAAVIEQQQALARTDETFQRAAQRVNQGCDFGQLVRIVAAVVTVSEAAGAAAGALVSGARSLGAASGLPDVIRTARKIAGDAESFRRAYADFRASVDAGSADAKILVDLENFERTLEPYLSLPEARQYREQMRAYVATTRSRNANIADLTAMMLRRQAVAAQIEQQQAEAARVDALVADGTDVALVEYDAFMGNLNVEMKRGVIRTLYFLRRALEYRGLDRITEFHVVDQDVAALEAVHGRLEQERVAILNRQARPKQDYEDVAVTFRRAEHRRAFDAFRRGGPDHQIVLAIPPDHEAFERLNAWNVTAKQVDVVASGARTRSRELTWHLTHCGAPLLVDRSGRRQPFSHAPRPCTVTRPVNGGARRTVPLLDNLGSERGNFAEVSPFATWRLRISERDHRSLDVGGVDAITLVFNGSFVAFGA